MKDKVLMSLLLVLLPHSRSRISSFTPTSPWKLRALEREPTSRIAQARGVIQTQSPQCEVTEDPPFLQKGEHYTPKCSSPVQSKEWPPIGSARLLPAFESPCANLPCYTGTHSTSPTHMCAHTHRISDTRSHSASIEDLYLLEHQWPLKL